MTARFFSIVSGGLLATALALFLRTGGAHSEQLHMTVTGNDTTGTGTKNNPFRTLRRCAEVLSDRHGANGCADTIVIHPGTYPRELLAIGVNIFFRGIDAHHYLVVMGDPEGVAAGNKPTYTTNDPEVACIWFSARWDSLHPGTHDIQYIELKNIVFRNVTHYAINMDDGDDGSDLGRSTPAHHVTFDGCEFYNARDRHAIKLSGVDTFIVRNCSFSDILHNCIDMVGCHAGHIYGNEFANWGGGACMNKGGSAHNLIEKNVFRDSNAYGVLLGQMTGWEFTRPPVGTLDGDGEIMDYESKDILVFRNVFINVSVPVSWSCSRGGKVYDNTFYCPRDYGQPGGIKAIARIYEDHQDWWPYAPPVKCRYGEFKNNIAFFGAPYRSSGAVWIQSAETEPRTFTFYNNLWYCVSDPAHSIPDWNALEATYGSPEHLNDVVGDPWFVNGDPSHPVDFVPRSNSPAVGMGLQLSQVPLDFFDRPYVNPNRTLGAFEAVIQSAPPTPPTAVAIRPTSAQDRADFTISWAPSPEVDVAQYVLYRAGIAAGPYAAIDSVNSSVHEYTDDGVPMMGSRFYYKLVAKNAHGDRSAFSGTASGLIIPQDANEYLRSLCRITTIDSLGPASRKVNWLTMDETIGYVQYGTGPVDSVTAWDDDEYATSHSNTIDDLVMPQVYLVRAVSFDSDGRLTVSAIDTITPQGTEPPPTAPFLGVYPNPFNQGVGCVTLANLSPNGSVTVYSEAGTEVWYATSGSGPTVTWDGRDLQGKLVASGVYSVVLKNAAGSVVDTRVVTIVR